MMALQMFCVLMLLTISYENDVLHPVLKVERLKKRENDYRVRWLTCVTQVERFGYKSELVTKNVYFSYRSVGLTLMK